MEKQYGQTFWKGIWKHLLKLKMIVNCELAFLCFMSWRNSQTCQRQSFALLFSRHNSKEENKNEGWYEKGRRGNRWTGWGKERKEEIKLSLSGGSGILLNRYEATCINMDVFKEGIIERKYYKLEKVESDYLNNWIFHTKHTIEFLKH